MVSSIITTAQEQHLILQLSYMHAGSSALMFSPWSLKLLNLRYCKEAPELYATPKGKIWQNIHC